MEIIDFIKILFRGVSQVMLQNNVFTGILFLAGIFYNSWLMGIGALIGVFIGTLTAFVLNYKKEDIYNGFYGFNGALVGIALLLFFKFSLLLIVLIILGSVLSSIFMKVMHTRKLFPYTFPFVLSTWILILILKIFNLIPKQTQELINQNNLNLTSSLSLGFGQVMFQASIITGIIFFVAILINSRKSAIYALIGSLIGMLTALLFSFPLNLINIGIFGFNAVLCGIAFGDKNKWSLFYAMISIILSVFIIYAMVTYNWVALTSPFVFAAWITLGIRKMLKNKQED